MAELVFNKDFFVKVVQDMGVMVEENRDHFTKLDSDIGDGDHGVNLTIGFREVEVQLEKIVAETEDISSFLRKIGMILLGKVGGSSGPLYGSFFIKAGADYKEKNEITFTELCGMIAAGVEAIKQRGKAEVGEKTMLDAFIPGLDYLTSETDVAGREVEIFEKFVEIMKEGAESTIPLIARKGRAMRLGERAIGHKDPGAESSWMLMDIISQNIKAM